MPFVVTTWPDGSVFINGECILRKGVPVPDDSDDDERLVYGNGKRILGMRDPNVGFACERRIATKPRKPRTDIRVTLAQRGFHGSSEYVCIDRPPWAGKKRKGEKDKPQHQRASQDAFNIVRMHTDDRKARHVNKKDPLQHYDPRSMKGLLKGEIKLDRDSICLDSITP